VAATLQLAGPSAVPKAATHAFRIRGLDCPDCAAKLERQLRLQPGVEHAVLVFTTGMLHFAPKTAQKSLMAAVARAGYQAEPLNPEGAAASQSRVAAFWNSNRRALTTALSGLFLTAGWMAELAWQHTLLSRVFFVLGMLVGGFYVARAGLQSLQSRTLDMNFLMSLAAVGAVAIGEWHEGAMVVFLFSLGNTLQSYTMDRTRQSIRSLLELAPKQALVRRNGQEVLVDIDELRVGETIVVRPGERIAMDGIITAGSSSVNQAPITGESMPVDKLPGDKVFAGTINGNGGLEVKVDRLAADNTLARIMHLVEVAQAERAPAQALVDRFAAYYTPAVIALAVLLATVPPLLGADFVSWFKRALILLVVSCPCALVISTPVSIVSSIGNASRNGVLIKGGAYLEAMGSIRTVAFDKTGTLTAGQVTLSDLLPLAGEHDQVLALAAALEAHSEHPLAQALARAAAERKLELPPAREFQALTGSGATAVVDERQLFIGNERLLAEVGLDADNVVQQQVTAWRDAGQTVVYLFDHHRILACFALADRVRPQAGEAIAGLRRAGIQSVAMLTGDHRQAAEAIGKQVGVDLVKAELLPEDKVAAIDQLLQDGQQVAMVGDGVNDAPALAASTVGISLGAAGTDAAIETADIALMADDLNKLAWLIALSRRTVAIIKQNIALSLLIKGVVLALTLAGRAELWMGVFADTGAALLVIANGMRLMQTRD
jgi:Cd2+/Zn2+-exporting ATPase